MFNFINSMPISIFDLVLLIIIAGFGLFGLWFGLIHTLGSLVGTVAGVYLASRYYEFVADWLIRLTGWGENFSRVIMFIIAFVIINRLVGLAFWFVDKILSLVTSLPFVGGLNRMLGLVFGMAEGALVLGIIFYFIARFPLGNNFMEMIAASKLVGPLMGAASILWPLLPEALRALKNTFGALL